MKQKDEATNTRDNLKGEMAKQGIKPEEMYTAMGIGRSTYYNRMKEPRDLTMGDLMEAARLMGVTVRQLVGEGLR